MQLLAVIRRDVVSKFAGEVLSRALFLVFFFYVGRRLGSTEFGILGVAISTTYILSVVFLDPGLNLTTIQLLIAEENRRREIASSIFLLKLLLFLPMVFVVTVLSHLSGPKLPGFRILLLSSFFALFTALLEYFGSVTNAYHRMDLEAIFKVFNRVCIVVFGYISLGFGKTSAVLWAMTLATLLSCVVATLLLRSTLVALYLSWKTPVVLQAARTALPIAGTLIVGTIYLKWDLLVLSYFDIAKQQIGWYAAAFKIVEALSALPTLLGAALFPIILQLRIDNPGTLDRLLVASTKAVLLFSIPTAGAISLLSRPIILFVYGEGYLAGARVLSVLIWCIVPIFVYFYLMFVNVAAGHAKTNLLAGCIALLAGLLSNVFLIPRIGYVGAAWSALIANSTFAFLATWKVCTLFTEARIPAMLVKLLPAGILMMVVMLYPTSSLTIQFSLGLLVYIIVLAVSGAVGPEDIMLLQRIVQTRVQPQAQL
jgi:O-antigen/teichoic acid export membrane protein